MTGPTVLELFAGIGGLSLGLERAGFRVVGQVEIDPFCRRVLEKHWPEVPRHDDVRTAVGWWAGGPRPAVDAVAGGYPCQPESLAGRGLSVDDERWLWPAMARVVAHLRPRFVIGENVMGHRTRGLRFVLRDLERLGYTARAGIVEAREMGAPHVRKRIVTLAELDVSDTPGHGQRQRRPGGPAALDPDRRDGLAPENAADTDSEGRGKGGAHAGSAGAPAREQQNWTQPAGRGWWADEPDVGRVAYGVPDRVDRIRALGNAVVPAVAEHVGRLLLSGAWRDV